MDASTTELRETGKDTLKPRFQLCFSANDVITNKGDVLKATFKLWGISLPMVTPKFYSPKGMDLPEEDEKEVQDLLKKLDLIGRLGPKEKYKEPLLESHRYGWFQERFSEGNSNLDCVHFPKKTSDMVRIHSLMAQFKSKIGDRCE